MAVPSGTLTFLFTDIEGSTVRWEERGPAMAEALARHDRLLRAAIEGAGGHVFKTVGDAFCAAFAVPAGAVEAAVAIERAIVAEDWQAVGGIRVRVAVHAGAVEQREGDYFGQPLNRVARLLAAVHGGQAVLTGPVFELVRDALPPGVSLRPLGLHRLKDLTRPEAIYEIAAPGMQSGFPALKSLDARPHNLPIHPTPLIGREDVLARVGELFDSGARLVTLTGPGGAGKTRLALQAGADLMDRFDDGVFFVNLAPIGDGGLLASAITQALGLREPEGRPVEEAIADFLREKSLLLILDNFEQIVAEAPAVSRLLAGCPRLTVLVTSRIVLNVRGERELPVPPLALPARSSASDARALSQYAAVRLFIERATEARPGFAVTNETAPAIAEICARLDGLPLAIELAAARVRVLSPEALLRRLGSLELLSGGARDLPERHRTLRNAIGWSYDLLDERDRRLFRRLGVFANGCTLAAAEAVCAGDGLDEDAVLPGLETLVASSLLRVDDSGREVRFWLLETLREFALDELEAAGEAGATRARHAAALAALAAEAAPFLFDGRRVDWLPRLESELDNLRAAIGWALESGEISMGLELLGPMFIFWYQQGHTREAADLTTRLLDAATARDEPPSLALGMTYLALGAWRFYMGNIAEAFEPLDRGLAIASALGDGAGQGASLRAMCLVYRGVALMYSGYPGDARPVLEEASALGLQLRQGWAGAIGTFLLADVVRPSDRERARELYQRSLDVAIQTNDLWAASFPLISLGVDRLDAGDYDGARELLGRALEYRRTQPDTWALAIAIMVHGDEARCTGDLARARTLTEEALAMFRDLGATVQLAWPLHNLGWIALREGDVEGAAHSFAESREIARQTSQPLRAALAESGLAAVAAARGEHDVAARMLGAAERALGGTRLERDTADRLDFERLVERLRSALGTERFDALFSGG